MLKAAVEAGRFGKLTFASAIGPADQGSWKGTIRGAYEPGHGVDLLQWLVGERVTAVNGRKARTDRG